MNINIWQNNRLVYCLSATFDNRSGKNFQYWDILFDSITIHVILFYLKIKKTL